MYGTVMDPIYMILQPYMRACTIITLHTEGDIFALCQVGNVWIEYTILLIQIQFYTAVFYGVLHRISPATFLQLKIQLEMARFEPQTFRVPV